MMSIMIVPALIGWIAGLIINYLADVLPGTRRFSQPVCSECKAQFNWKDYFLFRSCPNGHQRGLRPIIVQVLLTAISIYTWLRPYPRLGYFIGMILILYYGIVFVIDMEHRLILHPTSIFGAILGLAAGFIAHGLVTTFLGGLGGLLIMLSIYYFGVLFTKLRANRLRAKNQLVDDEEALGAGDVILGTILGLVLGWPLIWFSLFLGILLAGAFGLLMIMFMLVIQKYKENALMVFMPYGPFLLLSAFFIMFLPNWITPLLPK
jgi:prepilin signal peptidase PulO-like enzyme (type II secretory pathway)